MAGSYRHTVSDDGRLLRPEELAAMPETTREAFEAIEEPTRMYAAVRDRDGDVWQRRLHWWYCVSVGRGKLTWDSLVRRHGPVSIDAGTDRAENRRRATRGWGPRL